MENLFISNLDIFRNLICHLDINTLIKIYPSNTNLLDDKYMLNLLCIHHKIKIPILSFYDYVVTYTFIYNRKLSLIRPNRQLILAIEYQNINLLEDIINNEKICQNKLIHTTKTSNNKLFEGLKNQDIYECIYNKSHGNIGFEYMLRYRYALKCVNNESVCSLYSDNVFTDIIYQISKIGNFELIKDLFNFCTENPRSKNFSVIQISIINGAVCGNHEKILDWIINVCYKNNNDSKLYAISIAMENGKLDIVKKYWDNILLKYIHSYNYNNLRSQYNLIRSSIIGGNVDILRWITSKYYSVYINNCDYLNEAAFRGHIEMVLYLIPILNKPKFNISVLRSASMGGNFELVGILLSKFEYTICQLRGLHKKIIEKKEYCVGRFIEQEILRLVNKK